MRVKSGSKRHLQDQPAVMSFNLFYRVCTLERVLVSFNAGFTVTVDFSIHCFIDEKFMVCTPHRLQCKAPHFPKHKFPIHTGRWLGLGGQQQ